ncbi:hypothetical protein SBF1_2370008 [Candidatus Desulfosporosinus infrequens]|uniref:Uncharacterized protein n=1 Tax=Candidatus Desulfosporosinus infrequens TaxID=2043169 RepID=A0A2U3KMJ8_9FIRM|nr:hypothetical protein SBF1_2370008 [Candidatus Desulfosporosinus infrequens]
MRARRYIDFNPRSRVGSDYSLILFSGIVFGFQSTLPRRERHYSAIQRGSAP